jgi:hypothetical protein
MHLKGSFALPAPPALPAHPFLPFPPLLPFLSSCPSRPLIDLGRQPVMS